MSLYIFGELISSLNAGPLKDQLCGLCTSIGLNLGIDELENEDRDVLDESIKADVHDWGLPAVERLYFYVSSRPKNPDATELWIEAQQLAISLLARYGTRIPSSQLELTQTKVPVDYYMDMQSSRLGRFFSHLCSIPPAELVAAAIVDGGVDTVMKAPRLACVEEILRSMLLPWDCTSNTLYVFRRAQG